MLGGLHSETIFQEVLVIEIKREMGVFMFTRDLLCLYMFIKVQDYVLEEMDLLFLRWNSQPIWDVQRILRCVDKGNERIKFVCRKVKNALLTTYELFKVNIKYRMQYLLVMGLI